VRILLIEDDRDVAAALVRALTALHHTVRAYHYGSDLLRHHHDADVVVLDLGLPDTDGVDALRELRAVSTVPVIVLTARSTERSVVLALRSGADDFVVKPPRMIEFDARLRAIARRRAVDTARSSTDGRPLVVRSADVVVDTVGRTVTVSGAPLRLTPTEFGIISLLADNADSAVSREMLMDGVWGASFGAVSRSLDVHMVQLRKKLDRPAVLQTIRGFGFRWNVVDAPSGPPPG